jgi:hypothetical protein
LQDLSGFTVPQQAALIQAFQFAPEPRGRDCAECFEWQLQHSGDHVTPGRRSGRYVVCRHVSGIPPEICRGSGAWVVIVDLGLRVNAEAHQFFKNSAITIVVRGRITSLLVIAAPENCDCVACHGYNAAFVDR